MQLERDPATEKVTTVWVLYPDDPAADRLRAGDNVRIPEVGAWLQTVEKGQVRALTAARSLTAADLRDLVGGREPLAGTVTVKNARTGAGWP